MRAAFYTFGCKLNQYETESLASTFRDQGFSLVETDAEAEIYLINTCTVTSKSEQKARRFIRHLSRERPAALLLVTGCYAQLEREALSALGENVAVVPQEAKDRLLELPRRLAGQVPADAGSWRDAVRSALARDQAHGLPDPFRYRVEHYSFHSRAFLKIQDGCDQRCAYCRIRLARGASVSLDPQAAVERIRELERAGHREVVLTGVNISAYRQGELGLAALLERLLAGTSRVRIRLSSLEPETIKPGLAEALSHERICPHFHIPVQSGSDRVLLRMRRRYQARQVVRAAELLRRAKQEPFLAADIIAGFPGETEEDFQATWCLVKSLELSKLHVFPFSPRPGTPALAMKGRVPERIRDARVRELVALSERLQERYAGRWVGRKLEVVLEDRHSSSQGGEIWQGLSQNYLKVAVSGVPVDLARPGLMLSTSIEQAGALCRGRFIAPL